MNKTFGALAVSITLIAGLPGAADAATPPQVVVQRDRTGDVRTKKTGVTSEAARRFIKQSVDLKRVRYTIDRTAPTPKIRIAYKARNVLQANRRRDQQFRTDFEDSDRYTFAWIKSKEHGPVEVWFFDRGGLVRVPCPGAGMKLRPGPRNERVVQIVPLRCVELTRRVYIRSSAKVMPFHPRRFVSSDSSPETDLVRIR